MTHDRKTTADCCKLVLIRHEHTDKAGTFCGHLDPPLDPHGRTQLKQLAADLGRYPLTAVYSSDLRRAQETAAAIAVPRHLPIRLRADLRELAFGEWEGLSWKQVVARDPAFAQRWLEEYPSLAALGGEEFTHFLTRVQQAISDIADEIHDGYAAVVTHGGVIRTILASVTLECTKPIDLSACSHGSWWEIWRQNGRWTLRQRSVQSGLTEHEVNGTELGCTA